MPEDLKPCPFCAYTKTRIESWEIASNSPHTEYAVMCENCGAFGPNDLGKSGAMAMWNMRRKEYPPAQKSLPTEAEILAQNKASDNAFTWGHCLAGLV